MYVLHAVGSSGTRRSRDCVVAIPRAHRHGFVQHDVLVVHLDPSYSVSGLFGGVEARSPGPEGTTECNEGGTLRCSRAVALYCN
eukprot:scaffold9247_cov72-Phaeocystis_antarctica.AAC.2